MPKLLGFQKRTGGGQASSDQMIRILEKTYLSRTPNGEFSNEGEVQGLIDSLSKMPQTPDVMEKVAELQDKKLQIGAKQNDILNSKAVFEDNLNDALRIEARNNYNDIGQLIGNYMNVYADAEEKIDGYINDNVYKRYGSYATPPQDLLDLKNKIKEKARYYSTLTASLATPEGTSAINTDALAVQVQTNPVNGNIISLDVVPRGQVPKDYMQTDIKTKISDGQAPAIPMYINAVADKVTNLGTQTKSARLGSMNFKGVDSSQLSGSVDEVTAKKSEIGDSYGVGQLKAQNENVSTFDWLNVFSDSPSEKVNQGLDVARTQGMTLKDFSFDGNDVPPKSVVRKGNRLYFQQENGDVSEFDGKDLREKSDNAKRYLSQIGVDPKQADTPSYVDDTYFVAKDGSYKVKDKIGADYFSPSLPPSTSSSTFVPTASSTPQANATTPENKGLTDSFFSNTNRMNKPNDKTQTTTPSIIEQGKGFFRKMLG